MTGEVDVSMWQCGDEECDCSRPEVKVREYSGSNRFPKVIVIAEGPFVTRGYGADEQDIKDQAQWFIEARAWYHKGNI